MPPVILVEALHKTYRSGRLEVPALRGVGLSVEPGEFVAVMGPSGSGKSTLFYVIGGLTPPTSGRVVVAGQDLAELSDAGRTELRKKKLGFVFQRFNLLPSLTAEGNIAMARHISGTLNGYDPASFRDIIGLLGIQERLNHKPAELSGGEQQRVAIARALVNHPAILLADEPTGNLDTESSSAVLTILQDLNRRLGQTILMITHNPEAAVYAHRIVLMRDGRIVGQPGSEEHFDGRSRTP